MGWIFLWAFLDKLFGLGFSTEADKAWIAGGSPTKGFLTFATKGPLAEFYQSIAGHPFVDCLFMTGLLLVGVSLLLGIMVKIAGYSGALMMVLMYTASALPPETNPILDSHIIYSLILVGFSVSSPGDYLGLGTKWKQSQFVQKYKLLV